MNQDEPDELIILVERLSFLQLASAAFCLNHDSGIKGFWDWVIAFSAAVIDFFVLNCDLCDGREG